MLQCGFFIEPALISRVCRCLPGKDLAVLSVCAFEQRRAALQVANSEIERIVSSCTCVSKWRREFYASKGSSVLEELHYIDFAVCYIPRIAGKYHLSDTVVLDILPSGKFENYSYSGLDEGHRFKGQTTIAAVSPAVGAIYDMVFHFDRWYEECVYNGQNVPADELDFVGPGYQCYSLSAFLEQAGDCGVLLENTPFPDTDRGWDTSAGVDFNSLRNVGVVEADAETSPSEALDGHDEESADDAVSQPLRVVAKRDQRFPWVGYGMDASG